MSLELIIGCMFSGKSSTLLRKIRRLKSIKKKCAVINHDYDTRCEEQIKTHANDYIEAIKLGTLGSFTSWEEYDVIAIDESQFFPDIVKNIKKFLKQGKQVIVAGLSGDFNGKPFDNISQLISLADNIHFTKALCIHCRDGTPAIFSKRKTKNNERIISGAAELYEPVCRVHFCM